VDKLLFGFEMVGLEENIFFFSSLNKRNVFSESIDFFFLRCSFSVFFLFFFANVQKV